MDRVGLAKPQIKGTVVIRMACGRVRLSEAMQADPESIPPEIRNELPDIQKKELGLV